MWFPGMPWVTCSRCCVDGAPIFFTLQLYQPMPLMIWAAIIIEGAIENYIGTFYLMCTPSKLSASVEP